jgi:hypothetical protein
MRSERLKAELSELRMKVLDIRDFNSVTPENFKTIHEAVKNLQSIMLEMVFEPPVQNTPPAAESAPVLTELAEKAK